MVLLSLVAPAAFIAVIVVIFGLVNHLYGCVDDCVGIVCRCSPLYCLNDLELTCAGICSMDPRNTGMHRGRASFHCTFMA